MLEAAAAFWLVALGTTTALLAVVVSVQSAARWLRGRRRPQPAAPVEHSPARPSRVEQHSAA